MGAAAAGFGSLGRGLCGGLWSSAARGEAYLKAREGGGSFTRCGWRPARQLAAINGVWRRRDAVALFAVARAMRRLGQARGHVGGRPLSVASCCTARAVRRCSGATQRRAARRAVRPRGARGRARVGRVEWPGARARLGGSAASGSPGVSRGRSGGVSVRVRAQQRSRSGQGRRGRVEVGRSEGAHMRGRGGAPSGLRGAAERVRRSEGGRAERAWQRGERREEEGERKEKKRRKDKGKKRKMEKEKGKRRGEREIRAGADRGERSRMADRQPSGAG